MRAMQATTSTRPRRESASTGNALSIAPGKRRVLSIVLATRVVPRQTERVHMARRCMSQREAIGGRMAGVFEVQRFRGARIDAHSGFSGHIHKRGRLYGPLGSVALEANRSGFHAQEFSNQT